MKLLTSAEMRTLEAGAEAAGVSLGQLMENAGLAVAQEVWMTLGTLEDRRIMILAGPGNNGGDGLVAARHLMEWGAQVGVYLLRRRPEDDPLLAPLIEQQAVIVTAEEDPGFETLGQFLEVAELVVDALLGTGASRPVEGDLAEILSRLGKAREKIVKPRLVAVDLPTGVDADTGKADLLAVEADLTVALGEAKVGLYVGEGSALTGRIQSVDIGIPATVARPAGIDLLDRAWAKKQLPRRPVDANKGTFGKVMAVAGSQSYVGAASLAVSGAYRAGAGLVCAAVPRSIQPMVAARVAECIYLPLDEHDGALTPEAAASVRQSLEGYAVLLAGCGVGAAAADAMRALLLELDSDLRGVVIDADGLNALATTADWSARLPKNAVMTPHPGEMSRLTGMSVADIQGARLETARRYAAEWGVTLVLKGANTVIAAADGRTWLSPFANPALASAGTGDVLAGVIAGLLAQGLESPEAAACGVYLHGMAGDAVRADLGPAGLMASDLLPEIPRAIKALVEPSAPAMPQGGLFGGRDMGGLGGLGGLGQGGLGGLGQGGLGGLAGLGGGGGMPPLPGLG
jgi:ADP-dependent NAD(P)H-hydrate dehydratase / NAD(P)H-hydrate epimerase